MANMTASARSEEDDAPRPEEEHEQKTIPECKE